MPDEMTVTLSVSRKLNDGNYGATEIFMAVAGVPVGASVEQIQAALVTGELAFQQVAAAVWDKASRLQSQI